MTRDFRHHTGNWLTGSLHLVIAVIAAQIESARAWPYALAAMAALSFFAWMANYRRYRQVHDLPTSKVASAAQGYVELFGRSMQIPDSPVTSPLSGLPCCWYRYCIERRVNNKWQHEDSGESIAHFLLVDDTGQCVISPDGAEVPYARHSTWTQTERRYTEWLLLPEGPLYAVGEFLTTGGADFELNENKDIGELLGEWKKDQPSLIARFDSNRDGNLDLAEWESARLEARREVEKNHAEVRSSDGVHLLRKPGDGRVFLLAAALPARIGKRFALWSALHLFVFVSAGLGAYYLFAVTRAA